MTELSLIVYLKNLPYFDALDEAVLASLAGHMRRRVYTAGENIFSEGDPADGLWLIETGTVKIFKINPEGEELILHLLSAGKTFNDIAALDGGLNPANAAALSDARIWLLPVKSFHGLLLENSQLALKMIRLLATRVRGLVHRMEDLTLYSVTSRLARFLLMQAEDPALSAPGVTRATIAAHLATRPETISRALRTLEESGAIQFDRHRILIVDEALLKTLAAL